MSKPRWWSWLWTWLRVRVSTSTPSETENSTSGYSLPFKHNICTIFLQGLQNTGDWELRNNNGPVWLHWLQWQRNQVNLNLWSKFISPSPESWMGFLTCRGWSVCYWTTTGLWGLASLWSSTCPGWTRSCSQTTPSRCQLSKQTLFFHPLKSKSLENLG